MVPAEEEKDAVEQEEEATSPLDHLNARRCPGGNLRLPIDVGGKDFQEIERCRRMNMPRRDLMIVRGK